MERQTDTEDLTPAVVDMATLLGIHLTDWQVEVVRHHFGGQCQCHDTSKQQHPDYRTMEAA